jgi:hypothetical protein
MPPDPKDPRPFFRLLPSDSAAGGRVSLLSLLEALIRTDGRPPAFWGRVAFGVDDGERVRWLLASFTDDALSTELSEDPCAGAGFDCLWFIFQRPDARTLAELESPSFAEGDRTLLTRVIDRLAGESGGASDARRELRAAARFFNTTPDRLKRKVCALLAHARAQPVQALELEVSPREQLAEIDKLTRAD